MRGATYHSYIDRRANFPYYIYRAAGVGLLKSWSRMVKAVCARAENYAFILQGFFAGEGNVKYIKRSHSRTVRIAQGERYYLLERILKHFGVSLSYGGHREYSISGRENLEKLHSIDISKLHKLKHKKFTEMIKSYKQRHYSRGALRLILLGILKSPFTTASLAGIVRRTNRRVGMALTDLARSGLVQKYRVRSQYYWIRADRGVVMISPEKRRILRVLQAPARQAEITKAVGKSKRSV